MKTLISLFFLFTINAYAQERPDLTDAKALCIMQSLLEQSLPVIEVNDQKFYGLFTKHSPEHLTRRILELINLLYDENKRAAAQRELRNILASHSDIVESEKCDVLMIVELLQSPDMHLQWIGIEQTETEFNKYPTQFQTEYYIKIKNILENFFTSEESEELLHFLFYNHAVALVKYPELFKGIEFVPLDDDYYKKQPTLTVIINILEDMGRIHPSIKRKFNLMAVRAETNVSKIPPEEISAELSKIEDAEIRMLAASFFQNINQWIEEIWQRDEAMASRALRQSGNGLIILGSAHAKGVTQHLLSEKEN